MSGVTNLETAYDERETCIRAATVDSAFLCEDEFLPLGGGTMLKRQRFSGFKLTLAITVLLGGASVVAPVYISELSPAAYRGRLVTITQLKPLQRLQLLAILFNTTHLMPSL